MNSVIDEKRERLIDTLRSYASCLVAFSAGVDSTVVAKAAQVARRRGAAAVRGPATCSLLAVDQQKHTAGVAPHVFIYGASGGHTRPAPAQPLTLLQQLSLQEVDELWPCVRMHGKHRAGREAHELHGAAIGPPEVFHFNP